MKIDLSGRVALVTGASRGLGRSMAGSLAGCGAKVAVNYFGSADLAANVVAELEAAGGVGKAFQADVTDEGEVKRLVAEVVEALGPIDIAVMNATGTQPFIKLEDLTWQDMRNQIDFFVKSPLFVAQQVVPGMKERRYGRIINIGSEVFERGVPEFSNYVSAKGAQLGLTRSWAMELAQWQITVNHVSPG